MQAALREFNVKWCGTIGSRKACFSEYANKSLQILIHKYLTVHETLRYIYTRPSLVLTYKCGHHILSVMSPCNANLPGNEAAVQMILHKQYKKRRCGRACRYTNLRFKVGDLARLKT